MQWGRSRRSRKEKEREGIGECRVLRRRRRTTAAAATTAEIREVSADGSTPFFGNWTPPACRSWSRRARWSGRTITTAPSGARASGEGREAREGERGRRKHSSPPLLLPRALHARSRDALFTCRGAKVHACQHRAVGARGCRRARDGGKRGWSEKARRNVEGRRWGSWSFFFSPLPQLFTLSLSSLFFDLDEQSSISDALASLVRPARASPAPGIPPQPRALISLL